MGTLMRIYSSEFSLFTALITQYSSSLFYDVQTKKKKNSYNHALAEGLLVFNSLCEYKTTGQGSEVAENWSGMKKDISSYIYFAV